MGFETDRFTGVVEERYKCGLCQGVLDNPVWAPCRRTFCSGCILPSVLQYGQCPLTGCSCTNIGPGHLEPAADIRREVLRLTVTCDFRDRGCSDSVALADLGSHVETCDFRPLPCRNRGCNEVVLRKDLAGHEEQQCEWRPVGLCAEGCGMVLTAKERAQHTCIDAMREHISNQELMLSSLETQIKNVSTKFNRRERSLLATIAGLHSELQVQGMRFQKKLHEYKQQIAYLAKKASQLKTPTTDDLDTKVTLVLRRDAGNLGFNIMGGYLPDKDGKTAPADKGVIVSRITEGGPAEANGLRLYDQILQVSDLPTNPAPIYVNFPPVQVNGQDLSKSTHEEAVEAFRTAKEPIVVEVLRRVHKNQTNATMHPPSPPSPTMVTVSTQTDEYIDDPIYWDIAFPPPPASPDFYSLHTNGSLIQPSSRQPVAFSGDIDDVGLTDIEVANGLEYDDNCYEMEYEEVSLNKLETRGKIGLTLCYGSADEDFTDIFVSEIEPHSVAASDGRIHEGDQILQINGVDVHSREQAIRLFGESQSEITLLLARPRVIQMDDGFMEEHSLLDDLQLDMLEQHHHRNMEFTSNFLSHGNDEEGGTTDTGTTENSSNKHEKDSGVGRTDESTKNEESSEQEIMENECLSPDSSTKYPAKLGSGELRYSNESFTSNEAHENEEQTNEISAEECDKFREVLEHRYSSVDNSPAHGLVRKDSQSSIEREIAALNKEMEQIQLECEEIVEAHARHRVPQTEVVLRTEPYRSPRMVPRMGTRLDYLKQVQALQESNQVDPIWVRQENLAKFMKDSMKPREVIRIGQEENCNKDTSSSGFNTADSSRSTPLTLELSQAGDKQALSLNAKPVQSDKTANKDAVNGEVKKRGVSKSQSSGSFSEKTSQTLPEDRSESLQDLYAQYADVMYTNRANLEHTIMVQQKLFQQQLTHRGRLRDVTKVDQAGASSLTPPPVAPSSSSSGQQQMEWVVKRRADGSRYITRRPVRNKILKERAKKLAEERGGMTTDDDAVSELKVGRYWSKEDRKRHLEKARDYKRRKEMMKQKMETLKENEEVKKEPNIVELSHRKMMKHKAKKVFDDFTTVQEMLAHGSREPQGKTYNPLLSVTTV